MSRVRRGRIFAKHLLDDIDALEKERPVDRGHEPHCVDQIADGELVGRFPLVFETQHFVCRIILLLQCAVERLPGWSVGEWLIAQPLEELDDESGGEAAVRSPAILQHLGHLAVAPGFFRKPDVPATSLLPRAARLDDPIREPPKFLDERQSQHQWDRPGLADRQLRGALIRAREIDDGPEVDSTGGVRHELAREHVNAWIAGKRAAGKLRQLLVVAPPRQVLANFAHLILDDVVVVAQPVFRSNGHRPVLGGRDQELVGRVQAIRTIVEPRQERLPAPWIRRQIMRRRNLDGVSLELVGSEDFRCDTCISAGRDAGWAAVSVFGIGGAGAFASSAL